MCASEEKIEQIKDVINSFGLDAKVIKRKEHFVVYLKDGEHISDLLNVIEAHVSLMDMDQLPRYRVWVR